MKTSIQSLHHMSNNVAPSWWELLLGTSCSRCRCVMWWFWEGRLTLKRINTRVKCVETHTWKKTRKSPAWGQTEYVPIDSASPYGFLFFMDFDADDHFYSCADIWCLFFSFLFFFFSSRQVRRHWGINNSYIPLCAHACQESCVFVCAVITPAGLKWLFLFCFFFSSPYSNLRLFLKPKTKERSGFNSTKLKYKNKGTHNWNQCMNTIFFFFTHTSGAVEQDDSIVEKWQYSLLWQKKESSYKPKMVCLGNCVAIRDRLWISGLDLCVMVSLGLFFFYFYFLKLTVKKYKGDFFREPSRILSFHL